MNKLNISKKFKTLAILSGLTLASLNTNNTLTVYAKAETTEDAGVKNYDSTKPMDMVEKYSEIYNISKESLIDYLDYYTDGYYNFDDDNYELTIISAAKELYETSRNNGYYDKIASDKKHVVTKAPEELVEEYSDIIGTNKYIAMAIAYSECGSPIENDWNYQTNGNIAGIGGDMYFENAEIGVIYYAFMLKNGYDVTKDSDDSVLSYMASTYCPPNADAWENHLARPIYNELMNNGFYTRALEETKERNKTKQK